MHLNLPSDACLTAQGTELPVWWQPSRLGGLRMARYRSRNRPGRARIGWRGLSSSADSRDGGAFGRRPGSHWNRSDLGVEKPFVPISTTSLDVVFCFHAFLAILSLLEAHSGLRCLRRLAPLGRGKSFFAPHEQRPAFGTV